MCVSEGEGECVCLREGVRQGLCGGVVVGEGVGEREMMQEEGKKGKTQGIM